MKKLAIIGLRKNVTGTRSDARATLAQKTEE